MTEKLNRLETILYPIVNNVHCFLLFYTLSSVFPFKLHVDIACLRIYNTNETYRNGYNFLCFMMLKMIVYVCCKGAGQTLQMWTRINIRNYWIVMGVFLVLIDIIATIVFIGNSPQDKCIGSRVNLLNIIEVEKMEIVIFIATITSLISFQTGLTNRKLYNEQYENITLIQYFYFLTTFYVICNLLFIVNGGILFISHPYGVNDSNLYVYENIDNLVSVNILPVGLLISKVCFVVVYLYLRKSLKSGSTHKNEFTKITLCFIVIILFEMGIVYIVLDRLTKFTCSNGETSAFPDHTFSFYLLDIGIVMHSISMNYWMGMETRTKIVDGNQKYSVLGQENN